MLSSEIGFRYTATDYLDDVSSSYVNMDTLFRYKGKQSVDLSFRTDELTNWDGNYPNDKFVRGDNMKKIGIGLLVSMLPFILMPSVILCRIRKHVVQDVFF